MYVYRTENSDQLVLNVRSNGNKRLKSSTSIAKDKTVTTTRNLQTTTGTEREPPPKRVGYKLFWFLIVTLSSISCGYQVVDRVKLYFQNPTLTKAYVLRNDTLKFPSLTFCPNNNIPNLTPYKQNVSEDFCSVTDHEFLEYWNTSFEELWELKTIDAVIRTPQLRFLSPLAIQLPEMPTMDVSYRLMAEGNCTTYSIHEPLIFKGNVLQVLVRSNIQTEDLCDNIAYVAYLHEDNDDMRFYPELQMKFELGTRILVGLKTQQFKFINSKEKPCFTMQEANLCRSKCLEKHLRKDNCCSLPFLDNPSEFRPCRDLADTFESLKTYKEFQSSINYNSDCNCRSRCEEIIYSNNLHNYAKAQDWNCCTWYFLFFEDNAINVVEELYSYSIGALLSDIGGNIGLFLGLSVLSIMDIIEYTLKFYRKRIIKLV